jgi:hypothetical protein
MVHILPSMQAGFLVLSSSSKTDQDALVEPQDPLACSCFRGSPGKHFCLCSSQINCTRNYLRGGHWSSLLLPMTHSRNGGWCWTLVLAILRNTGQNLGTEFPWRSQQTLGLSLCLTTSWISALLQVSCAGSELCRSSVGDAHILLKH